MTNLDHCYPVQQYKMCNKISKLPSLFKESPRRRVRREQISKSLSTMCYRIFIAFVLMCLLNTGFVRSQQCKRAALSKRYQLGRCPKCPRDSPELLASPWYGASRYWGQIPSPVATGHLKNTIFYEPSSPYAGSALKQRESRRERDLSVPYFTGYASRNYGYFNPHQISPSSILPRSPMLQTLPQYGFPPEQYLSTRGTVAATDNAHSRFPRHYGSFHQNQIQPRNFNFGQSTPYPQQVYQYGNDPKIVHGNRQINIASNGPAVIDTPLNKKVFVVYRADADPSMGDLNNDKKLVKTPRSVQNVDNNGVIRVMKSMNHAQLEEMLKRAIEISAEHNNSGRSHQRRQINNNENEPVYENFLNNWRSFRNLIGRGLNLAGLGHEPQMPVDQTPFTPPQVSYDREPIYENQGYDSSPPNLPHRVSLATSLDQFYEDDSDELYNHDYEYIYDTLGTEESPHKADIFEMGTLVLPKFTYDSENLENGKKESFSKKREINPQEWAMVEQSKQSKLSVPINSLTSSRSHELNVDVFANRENDYKKEEAAESPEGEKAIERSGKDVVETSTLQPDPDFVEDMAEPPTTVMESTLERNSDDPEGTPSTLST